jgi:hypothetical protein
MAKVRKKNSPLKIAKAKAWKAFSIYIRRRDADDYGQVKCVTCEYRAHWRQMQAGHFIAGRGNAILFEEKGVHAQCRACNYNEGNGPMYFIFMEETYGREEIERQIKLKGTILKRTEQDYLDLLAEYQAKVDMMGEE